VPLQLLQLEDRCVPSGVPVPDTQVVPVPTTQVTLHQVLLNTIFWNGGPKTLSGGGVANLASPDSFYGDKTISAGKTITLTNYSSNAIYPFLRGNNIGNDLATGLPYDPQDKSNHEFRVYVAYSTGTGKNTQYFLGLPSQATITFEVPLALWDGDNFYIATDGANLTKFTNIFNYNPDASIAFAGNTPVIGDNNVIKTIWMQGSNNYPAGYTPLVMFYYGGDQFLGQTVSDAAPAQLGEITFRDQYLTNFFNDPKETHPLLNYDVSYVNNLTAPEAMEASNVPITFGGQTFGPPAPQYLGSQDYGWVATNQGTTTFDKAVQDFVSNNPNGVAYLGNYFGNNQGWPAFYNPTASDIVIPAGSNVFADSPLDVLRTSPYDASFALLNSNGKDPIGPKDGIGGNSAGQTDNSTITLDHTLDRDIANLKLVKSLLDKGYKVFVTSSKNGSLDPDISPGTTLKSVDPSTGIAVINGTTIVANQGLHTYTFKREAADPILQAITNLWFGWAEYYYKQYKSYTGETIPATFNYFVQPNGIVTTELTNEITLTTAPKVAPLVPGMTVTAPGILPDGTTILRVDGNNIYLNRIPTSAPQSPSNFQFGAPVELPYNSDNSNFTTPDNLTFDASSTPQAVQFAGSVYEAMQTELGLNPPKIKILPTSAALVGNVIQFYANLPDSGKPDTGNLLTGEVRDVVKSVLRGVYDFNKVPDQSQWYPDPSKAPQGLTSGQNFNPYNLDPYVWFVHIVEKMSGYGFSVDDDVSNPQAIGPTLDKNGNSKPGNHSPNNLQVGFGGISGPAPVRNFGNSNPWFPTIPWGQINTTAKISTLTSGDDKGKTVITFVGKNAADAFQILNKINNPGTGQIGAYISAPGYIVPGTTLIFKGPPPVGLDPKQPQYLLSQGAIAKGTDVPITIFAGLYKLPKATVQNSGFETPIQTGPNFYTQAPSGAGWTFTGTAGIAANPSTYAKNNPAPQGIQVGYISNVSSISQSVTLQAGQAYAVSFYVAERLLDNGSLDKQTLEIRLDNGTVIGTFTPPSKNPTSGYVLFTSNAFKVNDPGPHTITIAGTNLNGGDNTALIDAVTVTGGAGTTLLSARDVLAGGNPLLNILNQLLGLF
jgi:hypothetical protein